MRGSCTIREQRFEILRDQLRSSDDLVQRQMGTVMASFQVGLFVGGDDADMPRDNLDLERWFRQPKGHERHIHGHKHAGVRIVQEGPTLVHALDLHLRHPDPLTTDVLLPYLHAKLPDSQHQAIARGTSNMSGRRGAMPLAGNGLAKWLQPSFRVFIINAPLSG